MPSVHEQHINSNKSALLSRTVSAKRESERDGFQATRIFKSPEGERLKHSCIMVFCKSITKIKQEVQYFLKQCDVNVKNVFAKIKHKICNKIRI